MMRAQGGITEAQIEAPTFHGVTLHPAPVNLIYGTNGTGKTSLAKALADPRTEKQWAETLPQGADIYLYNEETIRRIVHEKGDLPGVYVLTEQNVERQKQIEKQTAVILTLEEEIRDLEKSLEAGKKRREENRVRLEKAIWRATSAFRRKYPQVFSEEELNIRTFAEKSPGALVTWP